MLEAQLAGAAKAGDLKKAVRDLKARGVAAKAVQNAVDKVQKRLNYDAVGNHGDPMSPPALSPRMQSLQALSSVRPQLEAIACAEAVPQDVECVGQQRS